MMKTLLLLFLLSVTSYASFVSVNSAEKVFIRDVDFQAFYESASNSAAREGWVAPLVAYQNPGYVVGETAFFFHICGHGFAPNTPYRLVLVNLSTNSTFVSSEWVFPQETSVIEFTLFVDTALAAQDYRLQLFHYTEEVPYVALSTGPALNRIRGSDIPAAPPRIIYTEQSTVASIVEDIPTCHQGQRAYPGKRFVSLLCVSREDDAYTRAMRSVFAPSFPQVWVNAFDGATVFNGSERGFPTPFDYEGEEDTVMAGPVHMIDSSPDAGYVFSGCNGRGRLLSGRNCNGFTTTGSSSYVYVGSTTTQTRGWFFFTSSACNLARSHYCLEEYSLLPTLLAHMATIQLGKGLPYTVIVD